MKTQRYSMDTGRETIESDITTTDDDILIGTVPGNDGAMERITAFLDGLTPAERKTVKLVQDLEEMGFTVMWTALPPKRFWTTGKPPKIGGFYPSAHSS